MSATLVCSIELSKIRGISLTVHDGTAKLTQTIVMDGTAITTKIKLDDSAVQTTITQTKGSVITKVEADDGTSTVTQTPTSLSVDCQNFSVTADTVSVKSSKKTEHESGETYSLVSRADMITKASTVMKLDAGSTMQLHSGGALHMDATNELSAKSVRTTIEGDSKATVKGTASLELLGAQIKVQGDAQVSVAAPITKVGRDITTIEGQMVEVKAALVKLG